MLDVKLASDYPKVCLVSIINIFVSRFWFNFRFGSSLLLRYRASKFIYSVSIYRLTDNFELCKGIDSIMTELWQTDQWLYGISSSPETLYKSRNTQRRLQIILENLQICSTFLHVFRLLWISKCITHWSFLYMLKVDWFLSIKERKWLTIQSITPPVLMDEGGSIRWNGKSKFRLILLAISCLLLDIYRTTPVCTQKI